MFVSRKRTERDRAMVGKGPLELFARGHGPTVVAFHGFGGTASELLPVLTRIADANYAVDAALMPGHGTRADFLQDTTFDTWLAAARARASAAAEAHGRVVLLGFSLGSLMAIQIAAEAPTWLAGLILLGNALTLHPLSSIPLAIASHLKRPLPDLYMLKPRIADLVDPTLIGSIVTYDRQPIRAALEVYRGGLRTRPAVRRVSCPTLVLHGRRDHVCPWRNASWFEAHAGTRDVTTRIFEKSAHVLACDLEREAVATETVAFLSRF